MRKPKSLGEVRIKPNRNKKKIIIVSVISVALFLIFIGLFYFLLSMNDNKSEKEKIKIDDASTVEKKDLTVYDVNSNKRPIAVMIDNNVGNNAYF